MGERSKLTTLCYIEKGDSYLMLHRVSKKHDVNKDKWIGIGGHFEENESPEECLLREAKEETGLTLTSWKFRGIVSLIFFHPALPLLKHPPYKPVSGKRRVRFPEAVLKRSCLLPTGSALTGLLF